MPLLTEITQHQPAAAEAAPVATEADNTEATAETSISITPQQKAFLDRASGLGDLIEKLHGEGVTTMDALSEYLSEQNKTTTTKQLQAQIGQITVDRKAEEDGLAQREYWDKIAGGMTKEEAQVHFETAFAKLDAKYIRRENALLKQVADTVAREDPAKTTAVRIKQLTAASRYPDADPIALQNFAKANPGEDLEKEAARLQKRHDATISAYGGKKQEQEKSGKPATAGGNGSSANTKRFGPDIPNYDTDPKGANQAADEVIAEWRNRNKSK
jgi:uncharacterized protein YidB (DUF937 family)